jgi:hypothetical protein
VSAGRATGVFAFGCAFALAACSESTTPPAAPAPPRTVLAAPPAAVPTTVEDTNLIAFLADTLGEEPRDIRLDDWWKITAGFPAETQTVIPVQQRICADTGPSPGIREVALCTRFAGAEAEDPGSVSLWRIAPDASDTGARGVAYLDGVDSGAHGEPGEVEVIALGPAQRAFVVHSPGGEVGRVTTARMMLYAAQGDSFVQLLDVASLWSNVGGCDADVPGDCVSRTCSLKVGDGVDADGFHPLVLHVVRESDAGSTLQIPIPRIDGRYRLPEDALGETACGAP